MPVQPLLDLLGQSPSGAALLHWSAALAGAGIVVAGLVLWGAGRRVLRPLFVATAAVGAATASFLFFGGMGQHASFWAPALGFVLGALAGLVLYRVAMAFVLAAVLAAAVAVGATLLLGTLPPAAAAAPTAPVRPRAPVSSLDLDEADLTRLLSDGQPDAPGAIAGVLRTLAGGSLSGAEAAGRERWAGLTPNTRLGVGCGAVAALLVGLVIGLARPVWGAVILTAGVGAAAVVIGLTALVAGLEVAGVADAAARAGPSFFLSTWGGLWLAGIAVQGLGTRKTVAKQPE